MLYLLYNPQAEQTGQDCPCCTDVYAVINFLVTRDLQAGARASVPGS